jgi:hypothetical protein
MAPRPLVLLHGWSDSSRSFQRLTRVLESHTSHFVVPIRLGDYVSMVDEVRLDDVVAAMDRAWDDAGLPRRRRAVDAVVHSTGALVLRAWLRSLGDAPPPVYRLLMLAPANFGSPLAHKGHSFLGRAVKGFASLRTFQTGKGILEALELASEATRALAEHDVLGPRAVFGPGGVLGTVLVGNVGYRGIKSIANEDGADGTVRVSTANLATLHTEADFATAPTNPTFRSRRAPGQVAFRVLDGDNHSTVALKDNGPVDPAGEEAILAALTVTDARFEAWAERCAAATAAVTRAAESSGDRARSGYHTLVTRVTDHLGAPVTDYFLEFYRDEAVDRRDLFAERFHREVIRKVHVNGLDPSRRALLVDCARLDALVADVPSIRLSVSASPELNTNGYVGYRTFADAHIGGLSLTAETLRGLLPRHETSFLDLVIRREQDPRLFTIR